MRSASSVAALPRRDTVLITSCIVGIGALAWAYLVHLSREMSSSSDGSMSAMATMGATMHDPGGIDVLFTFIMWAVMMVGMMSASATPTLLLFAKMRTGRAPHGIPVAVLLFALGYLAIWIAFSAAAALVQWGLHRAALLSPTMTVSSPRLVGAMLIVAGAYQLAPVKRACLRHCQSPLGFLMSHWRDGATGALRMGWRHGIYCLGCCWALMGVLFAVGVMNLAWVALLTVFILLEKIGRAGARAAQVAGVAMIGVGAFIALRWTSHA